MIFLKGKNKFFYIYLKILGITHLVTWDTLDIYWFKRIGNNSLNIFEIFKSLVPSPLPLGVLYWTFSCFSPVTTNLNQQ